MEPLNKAKFLVNDTSKLISLSELFNTDQGAMKSTGATQSGKLQPPGKALISSKMQKMKKRKCPVRLSGTNLGWHQWLSGATKPSPFTSGYRKLLMEMWNAQASTGAVQHLSV